MLSHFGSEHYCPLSLLRVHGSSMMEELEDHETDGQEENDNSDSDSDVPVLPPDPSAKVEEQPKEQNLLERAADTVFNLVKKFTGNGRDNKQDKEGDDSKLGAPDIKKTAFEKESRGESKGKIVTLVGHEELNENSQVTSDDTCIVKQGHGRDSNTSQGKCVSGNISHGDSPLCTKADNEGESRTCSPAPSACQLFAEVLGHYSVGCFLGRILFSKNENFTVSMNLSMSGDYKRNSILTEVKGEQGESYEKKESRDQENVPAEQVREPSTVDNSEEKSAELDIADQEFSVIIPETSSSIVKISSEVTSSRASRVSEYVDPSPGVLKPIESLNIFVSEHDEKKRETDDKTPSLAEGSVVTSLSLSATLSAFSSVLLKKSSEGPVIKDSFVDVPQGEPRLHDQQELDKQPVQSIPDRPSSVLGSEQAPSVTKGTSQQPLPMNARDISSKDEEKIEDNVTVTDELNGRKGKEATPSECQGPNSIHMMSQSSPDIDVLETKLTDKDGREGTAQLPEEMNLEKEPLQSAIEASESTKATDFLGINLEPIRTEGEGLKPDLDNQEPGIESTKSSSKMLESENVDDPVIQPTTPPSIDITDTSDSVLPLPAPPVTGDTSLSSHEFSTAASSAEPTLDTSILSKAQQAAVSSSAGVSSGVGSGGQKESIFVRLSNKIKVMEQNLNMSTLYMEQLHQR